MLTAGKTKAEAPEVEVPIIIEESIVLVAQPSIPEPTVKDLIITSAREYGLNEHTAVAIAQCESNFIPTAQNPNSSAGGVFQFIDGTWLSVIHMRGLDWTLADKYDINKNIDNAMWLAKKEGWKHWECLHMI